MPKLSVNNLVKSYSGRRVVNDVSLEVENGSVVGLLGPNGAGKTTTFYMTVGMVQPDSGQVHLDDEDITHDPMHVRARKGVGYLPQEASVFKKLSVMDNLLIILEVLPVKRRKRLALASQLLDELGIRHLGDQKAGVLSGGERRRLEIARALAAKPSFMLLDEPFAGIDPLAVTDIKQIIRHLQQRGIGILISDHNVRETLSVCEKAYILHDGKVIECGTPEHVAGSETACRNYLGNEFRL
jgi:lipopolysaccharide export system ATP-binding protein